MTGDGQGEAGGGVPEEERGYEETGPEQDELTGDEGPGSGASDADPDPDPDAEDPGPGEDGSWSYGGSVVGSAPPAPPEEDGRPHSGKPAGRRRKPPGGTTGRRRKSGGGIVRGLHGPIVASASARVSQRDSMSISFVGPPPEASPLAAGAGGGGDGPRGFIGRAGELGHLLRVAGTTRMVELYGPAGIGKSALAERVADRVGDDRARPVHWLTVPEDQPRPEVTLLRLLDRIGVPPGELRAALPDFPDASPEALALVCRRELTRRPAVLVADGVPGGHPGTTLLTSLADAVEGTDTLVLATSETSHTGSVPALLGHEVPPLTGAQSAQFLGLPLWTADPLLRASLGRPLFLRLAEGLPRDGIVPRSPSELFAFVRWALSPEADGLLTTLAELGMEELPESLARELPEPPTDACLQELLQCGILQRPRPGYWRLPPALRALAAAGSGPRPPGHSRSELEERLTGSARTGSRSPVEPYIWLASRVLAPSRGPGRGTARRLALDCAGLLARDLAGRNSLAQLLLLWCTTRQPGELSLPLAAVARQTGDIALSRKLLRSADDLTGSWAEEAESLRHAGRLTDAGRVLDGLDLLDADGPAARRLDLRAEIDIDRGAPRGAGVLLRRAVEAHQMAGSERGEAWAAYHYGRLRLLVGDPDGAEERLGFAQGLFARIGERRGVAWARTGLARVPLLRGDRSRAVPALERALAGHEATDDPRGRAWTGYHLALALADEGSPDLASAALERAVGAFRAVGDGLGAAWALHQLALAGPGPHRTKVGLLMRAGAAFEELGCPKGFAWTRLELGLRTADPLWIGAARSVFGKSGDEAGEHWADLAGARLAGDRDEEARALKELARFHPRWLLRDTASGLPRAARDTVPEPLPDGAPRQRGQHPEFSCRVRMRLLDEVFRGGSARLALGVEPGPLHSWAAEDPEGPPLLRVYATALGDADVEPAHSVTVWPTSDTSGWAEFRITPHREGPLRLRFTVEDRTGGTVLQQVETEFRVRAATLVPAPAREA
ncbi:tetratricopeptide repeat protein [Streptomyces inusitatus]|nr:tetratricopeptide repeat protein [Streptomyces inusitatus]